jgi:hypothetical protein
MDLFPRAMETLLFRITLTDNSCCVVVEIYDTPIALNPTVYIYPPTAPERERFLTFDIEWDPSTRPELLNEDENPRLFYDIQNAAVEAFKTAKMSGAS